jgi:hypothetical protein
MIIRAREDTLLEKLNCVKESDTIPLKFSLSDDHVRAFMAFRDCLSMSTSRDSMR